MAEPMVNNKQVNFWRGDQVPPTIYHIWIKDNSKMLLFDGTQWVIFLDNKEILDLINKVQEKLDKMQAQITDLGNKTVNKKAIKDNPVLDGTDLLLGWTGNFVSATNTVAQTAKRFDELFTTQIIE